MYIFLMYVFIYLLMYLFIYSVYRIIGTYYFYIILETFPFCVGREIDTSY